MRSTITTASPSTRLGKRLTGRRSDAVAKNVLDPFEVAEVCVWPMDLSHLSKEDKKAELNRAEYTLYLKVVDESSFKAVLNEQLPGKTDLITLPTAFRRRIIPADIFLNESIQISALPDAPAPSLRSRE